MTLRRATALMLALVAASTVAACGGGAGGGGGTEPGGGGTQSAESAWLALLTRLGLQPDQGKVLIEGRREGGTLVLTLTVPRGAPAAITFGDGLFGATAYAFADGDWTRVDTADIRTEIAPILEPGQSAEVRLPVKEADSYRVLVPAGGFAAWADIA